MVAADDSLQASAAVPPPAAARPVGARRLLLAALAVVPVGVVGALVGSQYVETRLYSIVVPGFVGLACAATACAVAHERSARVAGLAVAAALAATGASFVLTRVSPVTPPGRALPPYAAAAVVAWLWAAPPRR
jgi:hypothetical protein